MCPADGPIEIFIGGKLDKFSQSRDTKTEDDLPSGFKQLKVETSNKNTAVLTRDDIVALKL